MEEKEKKSYNQEQIDLILQGIRPEGMDYDEFKILRAETKKMLKGYLKGRMFHKSSWLEQVPDSKYFYRRTKTYVKAEEDAS